MTGYALCLLGYWFPNPLYEPQSGHSQVIPLQDIPQKFSIMHS